jgi:hypothetical protein
VEEVAEEGEEPQITTENALRRAEDRIHANRTESAILVDDSGNVIFEKQGDKNSFRLAESDLPKLKNAYLTHNHPHGRSFSEEDVRLLLSHEMQEIRAVGVQTVEGVETRYRYIMRRKDVPHVSPARASGLMRLDYAMANRGLVQEAQAAINAGGISVEQAIEWHHHTLWPRVITTMKSKYMDWLEYSREVW